MARGLPLDALPASLRYLLADLGKLLLGAGVAAELLIHGDDHGVEVGAVQRHGNGQSLGLALLLGQGSSVRTQVDDVACKGVAL